MEANWRLLIQVVCSNGRLIKWISRDQFPDQLHQARFYMNFSQKEETDATELKAWFPDTVLICLNQRSDQVTVPETPQWQ